MNDTITIIDPAADWAQPWWTRNNVTYGLVYYARTIARLVRASHAA